MFKNEEIEKFLFPQDGKLHRGLGSHSPGLSRSRSLMENKKHTITPPNLSIFFQALPMVTIVVGRKNNSKTIRIITLESDSDKPSRTEFPIPSVKALEPTDDPPKWANYVKGTLKNFEGIKTV